MHEVCISDSSHAAGIHPPGLPLPVKPGPQGTCSLLMLCPGLQYLSSLLYLANSGHRPSVPHLSFWRLPYTAPPALFSPFFPSPFIFIHCAVIRDLHPKSRDLTDLASFRTLPTGGTQSVVFGLMAAPSWAPASQSHTSRAAQLRPFCAFPILHLLSVSSMFQGSACR